MDVPRSHRPGELLFTLLLLAGALLLGREALRIAGLAGPSSPGFGPVAMVGVVLAGLALELLRILRERPIPRAPLAVQVRRFGAAVLPPPVAGAVLLLILYVLGLELVGFAIASFLFLAIAIGLLWRTPPLKKRIFVALTVAAGTVAAVRLLFQELFQILLP